MTRSNILVRKEEPQRKIISGRATIDGQRGDIKVAVSIQRKEKIVMNSRREPIDVIVTNKISLEDATFRSNRTRKPKKREEERWNDKGKHRSVRVYDEREDDEEIELDRRRGYWKTGSRRGMESSNRSSRERKYSCPECNQADKWEKNNRRHKYYY